MTKVKRISYDVKADAVQRVWGGETKSEVARNIGVSSNSVCDWVLKADTRGIEFLGDTSKERYSTSEKIAIVKELLASSLTLNQFAREKGISAHSTLQTWLYNYKNGTLLEKLNREKEMAKGKDRKKARQFNFDEKFEIVRWTIAHGNNYLDAASKFGASYQQVNRWVRDYNSSGTKGLSDDRGHKKSSDLSDETEYWKHKYEQANEELKRRDIASELLKKYREIERRQGPRA